MKIHWQNKVQIWEEYFLTTTESLVKSLGKFHFFLFFSISSDVSSPQQRVPEILVPWGSCLADKFAHFPCYLDKGAMSFSTIRFLIPALTQLDVVVVQLLSRVWLSATPWTAALQAPLARTVSRSFLRFMSLESVMLSNLSSSATLFSFSFPSFPASGSFPIHISPTSWTRLPPYLPTHRSGSEHWAELPVLYLTFPLATYFTHGNIYISILISQFVPPSPSPSPLLMSICTFSTSMSLFRPCK